MRMWMIPPVFLCRKHLLGEHVELHMLVGSINKAKSLDGYLSRGLIEPQNIVERHLAIAKEMEKRGYNHKSPLPWFATGLRGRVDLDKSWEDLGERCEECRKRW